MTRKGATRLVQIAVLLVAACSGGGSSLHLEEHASEVTVDFQFLGEHPGNIERIRLTEAATGRVTWEVVGNGEPQSGSLKLTAGENSSAVTDVRHGSYSVETPKESPTFTIRKGVRYRVEAWGKGGQRSRRFAEFELR